jgi:predicted transcriptional regulator
MTDDELRKLLLTHRNRVAGLKLSGREYDVFWLAVSRMGVTAPYLATRWDISVQNATTTLARMFQKGYLIRSNIGDPSGGIMFEYTPLPALVKA